MVPVLSSPSTLDSVSLPDGRPKVEPVPAKRNARDGNVSVDMPMKQQENTEIHSISLVQPVKQCRI